MLLQLLLGTVFLVSSAQPAKVVPLPSLYELYTENGIRKGLSTDQPYFTLNNHNITIYSGAIHYFRVPRAYWRDRLRKLRASGCNAVETYVPWNLHEPSPGKFDFGHGGSDFESFLDLDHFLQLAQEEDLFAIVRPGPYICSEWDFGGLPPWLLREEGIKVRTSDEKFMMHVRTYFRRLIPVIAKRQFTLKGPVIALQIENEYGSTGNLDKEYLTMLKNLLEENGIVEMLFTSDSPTMSGDRGALPGVLQTANFADDPEDDFEKLKTLQPNKPMMAMEFWTGWFDHWTEEHHTRPAQDFAEVYEKILKYPASVNMYMFHGGTNWGFMNGANVNGRFADNRNHQPDVTSYDYDAPISENGDYTEKYVFLKQLISKYNKQKTRLPEAPAVLTRRKYSPIQVTSSLSLEDMISQTSAHFKSKVPIAMEQLPLVHGSGQNYGYIVYRKVGITIPKNSILKIAGHVCDTVMVLINGYRVSPDLTGPNDLDGFGYWRKANATLDLNVNSDYINATLDLVVENWGRNNFGALEQFRQFKGLWQGLVYLNKHPIYDWNIIPLTFAKKWTKNLHNWGKKTDIGGPALYRVMTNITSPQDTYLDMRQWKKGIVIVNGFVLGRFCLLGPQVTLYLPAPLLKLGLNEILIFEHFRPSGSLEFADNPIYETMGRKTVRSVDYDDNFEDL